MKKRVISLVLSIAMICTLLPQIVFEANAHSMVMTANEFIGYLQYVVDRGDSKYGSGDQYSIGKYDGNKIYFDCWGLGESIICTDGEIVYNRKTSLNPWNLWDTSCGCGSYSGDHLKTLCQLSADFTNILPGEWLFRDDSSGHCYHVGYYIGNGKVIESTSDGSYNTQVTTIDSSGHSNIRGSSWTWTSHAMVPWIDYTDVMCSHSYVDCGVCSKCGFVYDWESTLETEDIGRYKVLNTFTPRIDQPYSAATAASSRITAGTTVDVIGIYTNAYKTNGVPNKWYKFESGGKTYFGYSGDFEFVRYFDQAISGTITSPAENETVPKASYPLKGTITSTRYPIQQIDAFLDGNYFASYVVGGKMSVSLQGSPIDTALRFQDLSPGQHWITLQAKDIHRSSMTVICRRYFYTAGSNNYTISFTDVGDTSMSSITVTPGNSVTLPSAVPHRFGENFWGWTYGDTTYQPGETFTPTGNMTLDGWWSTWEYALASGDSVNCHSEIRYPGVGAYLHFYVEESGYYTFLGNKDENVDNRAWLYDRSGNLLTSDDDSGGDLQFKIDYYLYADTEYILLAKPYSSNESGTLRWTVLPTEYTINFGENSGFITVRKGETVTIPDTIPGFFGKNFRGWTYGDTTYQPGDTFTPTDDMTLYADWRTWECTLESGASVNCSSEILYPGVGAYLHFYVEESGYYTFLGSNDENLDNKAWLYDSSGNLLVSDDDSGGDWQFKIDCYLYADTEYILLVKPYSSSASGTLQWRTFPTEYTIDFDGNGGTSVPDSITVEKGETVTIPDTVPHLFGYNFQGWEHDGTTYQPGETITPAEDMTLCSEWSDWEYGGFTSQSFFATIDYPGVGTYLRFNVAQDGLYTLRGNNDSTLDTYLYLYDSSGDLLGQNDDDAGNRQFLLTQHLTAGQTYIAYVKPYNSTYSGSMTWTIQKETKSGTCGDSLIWTLDDEGTLTISGTGAMTDYSTSSNAPWYSQRSSIKSVIINNGVTALGNCAFIECSSITSVTIPNSVTSIGPNAFHSCSGLTTITIPDGVTTIGIGAFYCTDLISVAIPDSVTTIGDYAFYRCSSLNDVYYDSTAAEWAQISIGSNNEPLTNATLHTVEPTVTGITVKTQPSKTEYWVGESLDTTGLTLTATYSDGSTQTITEGFAVSGFSSTTSGTKTVTVTYEEKTATFIVTVNTPVVTGIAVKTQPTKTEYWVGESLDTTGLTLTATYSDGSTETITEGFTVSGFSSTTAGTKTVTVTYEGKTATFTVQVKEAVPDENAPKIIVGKVQGVTGNRVSVDISLENNPGLVSATLQVDFDDSVLTLVDVQDKGVLGSATHKPEKVNPYILRWANNTVSQDYTVNGAVVTLVFEIKEGAGEGTYPISVSYDYNNYDIMNWQMDKVQFAVVNGSVAIVDVVPGDVNGDGNVDNRDSMILDRYLAKWDGYTVDVVAADVNSDGSVNNLDSMILARYLAKWEGYETLPYAN